MAGPTLKFQNSFLETIQRTDAVICQTLVSHKNISQLRSEIPKIKEYLAEEDKYLVLHSDFCIFVSYKPDQRRLRHFAKNYLDDLLEISEKLERTKVVVHIGKGEKCDFQFISPFLKSLKATKNLCLENASRSKGEIGSDLEDFLDIMENFPDLEFCFDTQHAFSAGIFNPTSKNTVDSTFEILKKLRTTVIHLNDSEISFGGCKDRHSHTCLLEGILWSDIEVFRYFVERCYENNIFMINETSSEYDYLKC